MNRNALRVVEVHAMLGGVAVPKANDEKERHRTCVWMRGSVAALRANAQGVAALVSYDFRILRVGVEYFSIGDKAGWRSAYSRSPMRATGCARSQEPLRPRPVLDAGIVPLAAPSSVLSA